MAKRMRMGASRHDGSGAFLVRVVPVNCRTGRGRSATRLPRQARRGGSRSAGGGAGQPDRAHQFPQLLPPTGEECPPGKTPE